MVHGDNDEVIPHHHAERLLDVAQEPKKLNIYPDKGHSNLDNRVIYGAMTEFFGYDN